MLSGLWNLLFFALALGILISFHELGHFLAARWCRVKVERFSIGFGTVLYRRRMRDGCEFALSAVPLGGYVKMLGEERTADGQLPPDAFMAKSLKQRALIIAAGPVFNIVLAFVFYALVNFLGVQVLRPVTGDVIPNSPAAAAGFAVNDELTAVNGAAVTDWGSAAMALAEHLNDKTPVTVMVKADMGQGQERVLSLNLSGIELTPQISPLEQIGLRPCAGRISETLDTVTAGGPAYNAGLEPGDKIIAINGAPTPSWYRVQDAIGQSSGMLTVEIERAGQLYTAQIFPEQIFNEKTKTYRPQVGIGVNIKPLPELYTEKSYGPAESLLKAASDTGRMSLFIVSSTYKLLTGQISAQNISGPIAIAKGAGQSASIGFVFFLSFLAAISVNLGILNLLPIPVLDGGQLLFIACEGLTGRRPGPRLQYVLSALGLFMIITLSLFAVFNDLKAL